ncbi:MAG: methyltransferase domain-containing protein [Oscillospiraceae bacterium]|jgi:trans-aconitate 2-methyltransferase|nr:methyltransferase domain-containing protein [Oscillospiraceae bacterium]
MNDWNPGQYLKFENERNKPITDLLSRVHLPCPKRVLDIGCGPGNSTGFLARRWPDAEMIGLDSSQAMLEAARERLPGPCWIECDATGDLSHLGRFDLVFSNAALQWMPDHERVVPAWFAMLKPGGVLAIQAPGNFNSPLHQALLATAGNEKWRGALQQAKPQNYRAARYYYDILSKFTDKFELWAVEYHHVLDSHEDMIEWYKGAGFRPYLAELDTRGQAAFLDDMLEQARALYPPQADGKILFEFRRLFFTAIKENKA